MQARQLPEVSPLKHTRPAVKPRRRLQEALKQDRLRPQGMRRPEQVDGDLHPPLPMPVWARSLPALSPRRAVKGVDEPPRFLSLPQRLVDRGPGKACSLGEPSWTVRAWTRKHLIHAQPNPKELCRRR